MNPVTTSPSTNRPPSDRRVDALLAHYENSHHHPINELIHFIAIPAIMISVVGLLYAAHPWVAYAFLTASVVYYLRLSKIFAVTMMALTVAMIGVVLAMGEHVLPWSVAIFVVAWIFQFIGHKLEGKKPSFLEDIQYLWVGSLFVLSKIFTRFNLKW